MVPIEQLGDRNFTDIYYISLEIKKELELSTKTQVRIPVATAISGGYPCTYTTREKAIRYLYALKMISLFVHADTKFIIDTTPQETFFDFCNKLTGIYNQRFRKDSPLQEKIKDLSIEEITKLKIVLDTIFYKMGAKEPRIAFGSKGYSVLNGITVPYNHFPSSIEVFDINGIIYKLTNDFRILYDPQSTAEGINFKFIGLDDGTRLSNFRKIVEERYSLINTSRKKSESENGHTSPPETIQKIEIINPIRIAKEISIRANSPLTPRNAANMKVELQAKNLEALSDGSIRYAGVIVEMRGQLKDLCRLFMGRQERLVTIDDIREEIIHADKRKTTSNTTISKYVSELHASLKLHFKKNVLINQKEEGWYFRP